MLKSASAASAQQDVSSWFPVRFRAGHRGDTQAPAAQVLRTAEKNWLPVWVPGSAAVAPMRWVLLPTHWQRGEILAQQGFPVVPARQEGQRVRRELALVSQTARPAMSRWPTRFVRLARVMRRAARRSRWEPVRTNARLDPQWAARIRAWKRYNRTPGRWPRARRVAMAQSPVNTGRFPPLPG